MASLPIGDSLGPKPISLSNLNQAAKLTQTSTVFNQIIASTAESSLSLKDRILCTKPLDKSTLEKAITEEIAQTTKELQTIESKKDASITSKTVAEAVQTVIVEVVLKTGADVAKTGVSFLLHTPAEKIEGLVPAVDIIKVVSDAIDLGTGVVSLIYKAYVIDIALKEIAQLKDREPPLTDVEKSRLEELEKTLLFENIELNNKATEQGIKTIRGIFSSVTFGLSWVAETHLTQALISGSQHLAMGTGVALAALSFYRAHEKLKNHDEWSSAFKTWFSKQMPTINEDAIGSPEVKSQITEILQKRKARHEDQVNDLKEKLKNGEIDIATIHSTILEAKRPALAQFLSQESKDNRYRFQANLEKFLGVEVDPEIANALREASTDALETDLLQSWIDQQSEDDILSLYVDYHSVLDPAIKNSLAEMVKKKHEIEHRLLKMKKIDAGSRFTAAAVIFAVAIAFFIVSMVATPVGAAALILTILTVGSIVLGLGFTIGGLLQYGERPGMTLATLKGEYVRLNYYKVRSVLSSLKEKIQDHFKAAKQEKRDAEDKIIDQLAAVSQLSSKNREESDEPLREKIKKEAIATERQSKIWAAKAEALNEQLEEIAWRDFAKEANLVEVNEGVQFKTLDTLNELLKTCNLRLLSKETKQMLKIQLGINTDSLQNEIDKDPLAVKRMVRNFFNLDEGAFAQFISKQRFASA